MQLLSTLEPQAHQHQAGAKAYDCTSQALCYVQAAQHLPDLAPPLLLMLLLLSCYRLPRACAQDACGCASDVFQP